MTYETFFSDGGHSGPHGSREAAIEYATAYIRGSEPTMWVAVVPTTVSLDFDRSKVLNASHRQKLGVTLVKRAKKNPSGRWIQKVDKRIEKKGTEGAFTKQAKRAGYNDPMEYAAKIMAAWRSGRKRVYNRKTKRDQKISLQLMRRANFALNVQSRRR